MARTAAYAGRLSCPAGNRHRLTCLGQPMSLPTPQCHDGPAARLKPSNETGEGHRPDSVSERRSEGDPVVRTRRGSSGKLDKGILPGGHPGGRAGAATAPAIAHGAQTDGMAPGGRKTTFHLPALAHLVLEEPLVSAPMIAKKLGTTQSTAIRLMGELVGTGAVRELTGRSRFRAYGIV